jgi:hypothetical protein
MGLNIRDREMIRTAFARETPLRMTIDAHAAILDLLIPGKRTRARQTTSPSLITNWTRKRVTSNQ